MTEIRIERRSSLQPWVLVIGIIVAAMVIIWTIAISTRSPELANPRQTYVTPRDRTGVTPVAAILAAPATWMNHAVALSGVISHVNDRNSMWVSEDGSRVLVVVEDPTDQTARLTEGQRVRVTGVVRNAAGAASLPAVQGLDAETGQVLKTQPAFVYARGTDVHPTSSLEGR